MADSFTTDEKVDFLFKKVLNKPCTITSREFFQEPSVTSRNFVYQDDIVSSAIPTTCPSDIKTLTDTSLDDNGRCLKGSYAGLTSSVDSNIRYYRKIPLEMVVGTSGMSYQAQNATTSHPGGYGDVSGTSSSNYGVTQNYGRVGQSSIPFNLASDGTYGVTLYKDTGVEIPFGSAGGGWVFDARPGVLTFFQYGNITGVSETHPPLISFYRYVGGTGGTNSSQVSDMVTAQTNTFTVKQIFSGGVDGSTNDQLAAVQIDNRELATLSDGQLLDAIQFGGDFQNSWRICVQKTSDGSRFLIQARESGVWVSKCVFTSP